MIRACCAVLALLATPRRKSAASAAAAANPACPSADGPVAPVPDRDAQAPSVPVRWARGSRCRTSGSSLQSGTGLRAWLAVPDQRREAPDPDSRPVRSGAAAIGSHMIQIKSAAAAMAVYGVQTAVTGRNRPMALKDMLVHLDATPRCAVRLEIAAAPGDAAWRASDRPACDRHPVGQLLLWRGDAVRAGQSGGDRRAHPRRGDRGGRTGGGGVPRLPAPQRHRGRVAAGRKALHPRRWRCMRAMRT